MIFSRLISPSLSPNVEKEDVLNAIHVLFSPTRWISGGSRQAVEKWFAKYFSNTQLATFNSARSALYIVLRAFGIGKGQEVLLQAFTCVAVPNSVVWTGATPVYVDIDETLNIDPALLEKKITSKTKAIIVQHTFGVPADMDAIMQIAKKHELLVIEDCAHSLGARYKGRLVGSMGDAAVFSFGRDKVISSVFGGVALIAKTQGVAWTRLRELHSALPYPNGFWIFQQVFHPVAFSIILPLYRLGIGKVLLWMLQKMRLLGFPVYPEEKFAKRPAVFPRKYPNALATLLLPQLKKLDRYNARRKARVSQYEQALQKKETMTLPPIVDGAIYLRYAVRSASPAVLRAKAKKHGVLLGNWYENTIDPKGVRFASVGYKKESCPKAEKISEEIFNLPTNISEQDAKVVLKQIS